MINKNLANVNHLLQLIVEKGGDTFTALAKEQYEAKGRGFINVDLILGQEGLCSENIRYAIYPTDSDVASFDEAEKRLYQKVQEYNPEEEFVLSVDFSQVKNGLVVYAKVRFPLRKS